MLAVPLRVASSDRDRTGETAGLPPGWGPSGIQHGYQAERGRTLCGQPLFPLHVWPELEWPAQVPAEAACYACELVRTHAAGTA